MAQWPPRVFAPYMYLGNSDHFKITDCADSLGLKYYTLAFIIADKHDQPAWYGRVPMNAHLYADQIAAIRQRGGDVICSFGGADGQELAIAETDPAVLQASLQSVIDTYHFTWLDFDVEGSNLDDHPDANQRRNVALAALQKKNPGLLISYTLPVDPSGIDDASQKLLADARDKGVLVYAANIMVMYFGSDYLKSGKSEAELGIESAEKARQQISAIDPRICIGLCPCIGTNGSKDELFTVSDANTLRGFADHTPWVAWISYWSINRDSESHHGGDTTSDLPQKPWDFAREFLSFTVPAR